MASPSSFFGDLPYRKVSANDLIKLQQNFDLSFGTGQRSDDLIIYHTYHKGVSGYGVIYSGTPDEKISQLLDSGGFCILDVDGGPVRYLHASINNNTVVAFPGQDSIDSTYGWTRDIRSNFAGEFRQSTPTATTKVEPQPITVAEIAARCSEQNYLFFTGAGISHPSVPHAEALSKLIGNDDSDTAATLAKLSHTFNHDLMAFMQSLQAAHRGFVAGTPKPAHRALAPLSDLARRPILTDNRDLLQQACGTPTIHVNQLVSFSSNPWRPSIAVDPTKLDGLIICGMGGDRRGFLQWLREQNPAIKFIHIDLKPSVVIAADYFLQGDVQILLPQLHDHFCAVNQPVKSLSVESMRRNQYKLRN